VVNKVPMARKATGVQLAPPALPVLPALMALPAQRVPPALPVHLVRTDPLALLALLGLPVLTEAEEL